MKIETVQSIYFSALIFSVGMLLVTGVDYLINGTLYSYGLVFSNEWYSFDQFLNFALLQFVIIFAVSQYKSILALVWYEAFVWTSTQDLVFFFGVWKNIMAPNQPLFPTGDWWWMPQYSMFGSWTTENQIVWSVALMSIITAFILFVHLMTRKVKKEVK